MSHAIRKISRRHVLLVLVVLAGLVLGSTRLTAAQEEAPAFAALTGTAYRLVDQTIVDGVVVDETEVPVTDGRIAIPELGIDEPLAADGTFSFSDLPVSADPNNPTEVTVIFTAPGLGSFTYLHLRLYPGAVGPNLTPQLIDTPRVDDHSLARDPDVTGDLPETGAGGPIAGSGLRVAPALLALLLGAGTVAAAHAQVTPYPVTLTMSGPATAVSGQEITYRLRYQFTDLPGTVIVITITQGASYVSSQITSGPDGSLEEQSERRVWWGVRASAEETEGEIEFVVRVDSDFVGSIYSDAYVPGTGTTSSNAVETLVLAPGTMPNAGGGGALAGSALRVAPALLALALVGAALICAAAAARG